MATRLLCEASKQPTSSLSLGSVSPATPSRTEQLPRFTTLAQLSKWPVSSAKAMLYEWAAPVTRVSSDEVLYIGWKSNGMLVQSVDGAGAYLTWPKPFRALVVIEPLCPEVRSLRPMNSPCAVSCIVTVMRSPEFMNRSALGSGVNVCSGDSPGCGRRLGCGRRFGVLNATWT